MPFLSAFVLLLLPGVASAQTQDIRALEQFHVTSSSLATTPITEEERSREIRKLQALSDSARRSSVALFRINVEKAEKEMRFQVERFRAELDRQIQSIENSYKTITQEIYLRAREEASAAKVAYDKNVEEINQQARAMLTRCTNTACRRDVEMWRQGQLRLASMRFQKILQDIEQRKNLLLARAKQERDTALKNAVNVYNNQVSRALLAYDNTVRQETLQEKNRASYILKLARETQAFIKQRPSSGDPGIITKPVQPVR